MEVKKSFLMAACALPLWDATCALGSTRGRNDSLNVIGHVHAHVFPDFANFI